MLVLRAQLAQGPQGAKVRRALLVHRVTLVLRCGTGPQGDVGAQGATVHKVTLALKVLRVRRAQLVHRAMSVPRVR
jgi:hypothetical protein